MNPLGGLPRRKKVLERFAGKPLLVLDAGNALFRNTQLDDDASKKRAKFILETMGTLGTQAMAVGIRDLGAGLPFLLEAAKGSKVKLLSANLRDGGKPVFDGSTILKVGGARVGVIGVSPASTGIPSLPATIEEVKKLKGKTDLIIVLAAMAYPDALQISTELKGQVDFVLQSGDSRMTMGQLSEGNVVIGGGERGRQIAKVDVTLGGQGAWVNADQAANAKQAVDSLDVRVKDLQQRRAGITDAKAKAELDNTLADFQRRRAELQKEASAATARGARTFKLEWVSLDNAVGDDEQLKAKVLEYEPTYAAPH